MYLCVPISKGYPGQNGGITKNSFTIINTAFKSKEFLLWLCTTKEYDGLVYSSLI